MMDGITAGAYVIRNTSNSKVLHLRDRVPGQYEYVQVVDLKQDEKRHRERQIWWIEPLPDVEYDERNLNRTMYSITNVFYRVSLELDDAYPHSLTCSNDPVFGAPGHMWEFKRVQGQKGSNVYNIGNFGDWINLLITKEYPRRSESGDLEESEMTWELVTPNVTVPPGWLHIQNLASGGFLSHKYLHAPAILLPPPASPRPSQHRESWGTQWALVPAEIDTPSSKENTWRIVNRLTGGLLQSDYLLGLGVGANRTSPFSPGNEVWYLEVHQAGNWATSDQTWTISEAITLSLLESVNASCDEGGKVVCVDNTFTPETKNRRRWRFIPPLLETTHEIPNILKRR